MKYFTIILIAIAVSLAVSSYTGKKRDVELAASDARSIATLSVISQDVDSVVAELKRVIDKLEERELTIVPNVITIKVEQAPAPDPLPAIHPAAEPEESLLLPFPTESTDKK